MSIAPAPSSQSVSLAAFRAAVEASDGLERKLDPAQWEAVSASANASLHLVAGPGSGKTTVIVLRILKLVLVDGLPPESILATTFTHKAAGELKDRLLRWSEVIVAWLIPFHDRMVVGRLRTLDFTQLLASTLDHLAITLLTEHRGPGVEPPVIMNEFVVNSVVRRDGLFADDRRLNLAFLNYAQSLDDNLGSLAKLTGLCREVRERVIHDQVDLNAFRKTHVEDAGALLIADMVDAIDQRLAEGPAVDFAGLERLLWERIKAGSLASYLAGAKLLLVDEYQDTNFLQESIYFALLAAMPPDASITVVGDDDQSLYRFRGATVELFRDFPGRLFGSSRRLARTIFLNRNYRSRRPVVEWCAWFAELDPDYGKVRVPDKPSLVATRSHEPDQLPVLGMF